MGRYRETFDERSLELAGMLQSWDVIGVYQGDIRPNDDEEYDDLVEVLRQDYGLDSPSDLAEIEFTSRVHDWWHSQS